VPGSLFVLVFPLWLSQYLEDYSGEHLVICLLPLIGDGGHTLLRTKLHNEGGNKRFYDTIRF